MAHFTLILTVGIIIGGQFSGSDGFSNIKRGNDIEAYLNHTSIIYGLMQQVNETNVNELCRNQLHQIEDGIYLGQPWAMKVFDASGRKSSAFLFGNDRWLGNRHLCTGDHSSLISAMRFQLEETHSRHIITDRSPFPLDYRVVYIEHDAQWHVHAKLPLSSCVLSIGLCVPAVCTSPELKHLMEDYVVGGNFKTHEIYAMKPNVSYVKDFRLTQDFYDMFKYKFLIGLVILTVALMAIAAISNNDNGRGKSDAKWQAFVMCFDLKRNLSIIFDIDGSDGNDITVVHGIRAVGAVTIALLHVVVFIGSAASDKLLMIVMMVLTGFPALFVDSFFFISGFLQAYNFLNNSKQRQRLARSGTFECLKYFLKAFLQRLTRIGIPYMILLLVLDVYSSYADQMSVHHNFNARDEQLLSNKWYNLLYINNFIMYDKMWAVWTWTMACDMQYYIFTIATLIIYTKYPKLITNLLYGTLATSMAYTIFKGISLQQQLPPILVGYVLDLTYLNSLIRIKTYILGVIGALYLLESEHRSGLNTFTSLHKILFSLTMISAILPNPKLLSYAPMVQVTIFAVFGLIFAYLTWSFIVNSLQNGSVWGLHFFEWKGFKAISRVSYAIYLINPLIVEAVFMSSTDSVPVDGPVLVVISFGMIFIVYGAAVIYTLAFDMPYTNISKLIHKRQPDAKTNNDEKSK